MDLTDEMLDTAMQKAIEAGLLPRCARREDRHGHRELIRFVLQGALAVAEPVPEMRLRRAPACYRYLAK